MGIKEKCAICSKEIGVKLFSYERAGVLMAQFVAIVIQKKFLSEYPGDHIRVNKDLD